MQTGAKVQGLLIDICVFSDFSSPFLEYQKKWPIPSEERTYRQILGTGGR